MGDRIITTDHVPDIVRMSRRAGIATGHMSMVLAAALEALVLAANPILVMDHAAAKPPTLMDHVPSTSTIACMEVSQIQAPIEWAYRILNNVLPTFI